MRGKDSNGKWRTPFDPHGDSGDVTEGTSWQYSWYVPHDVPGLIALMGGKEKFAAKLDELFGVEAENANEATHGLHRRILARQRTEPSHHLPVLLRRPAVEDDSGCIRVIKTQYGNKPDSLSGNDDCGQMSAWYIFTRWASIRSARRRFLRDRQPRGFKGRGAAFERQDAQVVRRNLSEKNIYVQSLTVNGKAWKSPFLPYSEIKDGGTIIYQMGPEPNQELGNRRDAAKMSKP